MNTTRKIIIFSLVLFGFLLFMPSALALSQCGDSGLTSCDIEPFSLTGENNSITPTCFRGATVVKAAGWCDFLQIASNVIGFAYAIVFPLCTIMIAVGGIMILVAGGNESRLKTGRGFVKSAVIGAAISLGAGIIIGIVIRQLGVTNGSIMPWLIK